MENGIVIGGHTYDLIDDPDERRCDNCALLDKCADFWSISEEDDLKLCMFLYGESANGKRFKDAPRVRVSGEDIMKEMEKYGDIRIALRRRQGNRVLDCHDCPHWQDGDDNVTCEYPDCPPCAEHELNEDEE